MVSALAQIKSHVETNAGLNRDYQKLLPVTSDFALDLGFNILPEHLSLPPPPPRQSQSSCIEMISFLQRVLLESWLN